MQDAGTRWPPHIGDDIAVTATGATGEVTEIIGAGAGQRFIVSIWPPLDVPRPEVQMVRHGLCTLDDLSPVRRP